MAEIALECKPDEVLVKALGYPRKRIIHHPSRAEVVNYLKKNSAATGIVDDDPGSAKPTYFNRFQLETAEKLGIECFSIRKLSTRLIVIKPRLEEWVLDAARLSKINPEQHSLPDDAHALHKIINTRLAKFENMLLEMLERNNPRLLYLKELINRNQSSSPPLNSSSR